MNDVRFQGPRLAILAPKADANGLPLRKRHPVYASRWVGLVAALAFAVFFQMVSASAEELALRCDPIGGRLILLFFIDTSRSTVREGQPGGQDLEDFSNRKDQWTEPDRPPVNADDLGYKGCIIELNKYVSIDGAHIKFGHISVNINSCGTNFPKPDYDIGTRKFEDDYVIDRSTGILTQTIITPGFSAGSISWQCNKITGNIF